MVWEITCTVIDWKSIRLTLPQTTKTFVPEWSYLPVIRESNRAYKDSQENYDSCHRVHELPEIPSDIAVFINMDGNVTAGCTVSMADTPRSYIVETPPVDRLEEIKATSTLTPEMQKETYIPLRDWPKKGDVVLTNYTIDRRHNNYVILHVSIFSIGVLYIKFIK